MTLRLKTLVAFPARVVAQAGIIMSKVSGVYTFALSLRDFPSAVPNDDMQIVVFVKGAATDGSEDVYSTMSLSDLKTYINS